MYHLIIYGIRYFNGKSCIYISHVSNLLNLYNLSLWHEEMNRFSAERNKHNFY